MKKYKFLLFSLLLLIPFIVIGQEVDTTIIVPGGWGDILANPNEWIASLGAIAGATVFIAAFFNGLFKFEKKIIKQITAWVVAILIHVGANLLNKGYCAEFTVFQTILYGLGAGFVSNGYAKLAFVKSIIGFIEGWFKPKS